MAVTAVALTDQLRATNLISHGNFVEVQVGNGSHRDRFPQASQRAWINLERMDNSIASNQVKRKHAVVSNVGAHIQEHIAQTEYFLEWQEETRIELRPHEDAAAYRRSKVDEHSPAGMDAAPHGERPSDSGSESDFPKPTQLALSHARLE